MRSSQAAQGQTAPSAACLLSAAPHNQRYVKWPRSAHNAL